MRHFFRRRAGFALVLALTAAATAGGLAYATGVIAGADPSTVVVCARNQTGVLRTVQDASQCLPSEHALELQAAAAPGPTSFTVDCAAGETIGEVLDQVAEGTAPVSIEISGVCHETVNVNRDDVGFYAASPGSGIDGGVYLYDARNIQLQGLTLTGGGIGAGNASTFTAAVLHVGGVGISLGQGSAGSLDDSTIENVSGPAIGLWYGGGSITVRNSTISHADIGIDCDAGAVALENVVIADSAQMGVSAACRVDISGGAVRNSGRTGVFAVGGTGSAWLTNGTVVEGNAHGGVGAQLGGSAQVNGAIVRNNDIAGVFGFSGGHLSIWDSTIEENDDGVNVAGGSTLDLNHTVVRNNHQNGLQLQDTSVALIGSGDNTITGNEAWGIFCQPPPAVAHIGGPNVNIGIVSGNAAGQNNCPPVGP